MAYPAKTAKLLFEYGYRMRAEGDPRPLRPICCDDLSCPAFRVTRLGWDTADDNEITIQAALDKIAAIIAGDRECNTPQAQFRRLYADW